MMGEPTIADLLKKMLEEDDGGDEIKEIPDPRGTPYKNIQISPDSFYVDPSSGLVMYWNGKSATLAPQWVQEQAGSLTGGGSRLASGDPRYWGFEQKKHD